jgi:two-component system cell cycle response regulator CpdR
VGAAVNITANMPARILVVDDEHGLRRLLNFWLERAGFVVEQAEDGVEALEKLQQCRFDIVLTDIQMPRMNGITLAQQVRARFPATKVLFVSGFAEALDEHPDIKRMTLLKPYSKDQVIEYVQSAGTWCRSDQSAT